MKSVIYFLGFKGFPTTRAYLIKFIFTKSTIFSCKLEHFKPVSIPSLFFLSMRLHSKGGGYIGVGSRDSLLVFPPTKALAYCTKV